MKRRYFILSATVITGAAIGVPWYYRDAKRKALVGTIPKPFILSGFCDQKEIIEIGNAYRLQVPTENNATDLAALIADRDDFPGDDQTSELAIFIDQKIQNDFQEKKTVTLKGWILSVTEARQCALLAITQPSS